ncbi:MAG TPA: FHA domain-containing protein [Thermoanaerobaculaceae bacterium]|nr:FHA domain-containing protein [Thermoanaerobaculaceae bacterium]
MELVLLDGSERRFAIEEGGELMVGVAAHCTVRLNAVDVSRSHALISCQHGKILLLDLGSTNGTFVNGRRVREGELNVGDTVRFSSVIAQVLPPSDRPEAGNGAVANGPPSDPKSPTSDHPPALVDDSLEKLLERWGAGGDSALAGFVEWLVVERGMAGAAVLEEVGGEVGVTAAHGDVGHVLDDPGCVALVRGEHDGIDAIEESELVLGQRRVVAVRGPSGPWLLLLPNEANPDSREVALLVRLLGVGRRIDLGGAPARG